MMLRGDGRRAPLSVAGRLTADGLRIEGPGKIEGIN